MTPRVTLVHLLVVVAVAAAVSGCGGSEDASAPKLPAALANDLARQSEAIAASIEAGDGCRAVDQARSLQQAVGRAIAANDVPAPLQRPLRAAVNRLVSDVVPLCEPPAALDDEEGEDQGVSCDALEAQRNELEERKKEIEEAFKEDKDERERRKAAIEEEKKALEEKISECGGDEP